MDWAAYEDNPLLAAQLAYDIPSLQQLVANNLQTFNEEQKTAYNIVFDSAMNEQGKLVFLHSAGGGGKTFVCNTIAAAVRAERKDCIDLCLLRYISNSLSWRAYQPQHLQNSNSLT